MNMLRPFTESIDSSAYDFPVETMDLYASKDGDPNLHTVPRNMARCIIRTDTNEVLGVHGSKYRPITHCDVVNSIADAVYTSAVTKDYEIKIDVFDNGAKMRGFVNFPDLTIEPAVGDIVHFRVPFYNSYDGSWSFQQSAEGMRLWCLNGCTDPLTVARTVAKHTTNVNVSASASKIHAGLQGFFRNKEVWKSWMTTHVDDDMAEQFFKQKVVRVKNNTSEFKYNFKQLDNLMGCWSENKAHLGSNKWALYNALTYWATHTQGQSSTPHVATRLRESIVAKAISDTVGWERA